MNSFWQQFTEQLIATSLLEWLAVVLAIAYLLLAIKESLWCWPAAFVSTAIYVYLFFNVNLFMESFLNLYYLLMAVYGWWQWRARPELGIKKNMVTWSVFTHSKLIISTFVIVLVSSTLLQKYTTQDFPLIDSFTTWFAILTTYMVTQKVIENWLYWIVINAVSIYLYIAKGFALTAVLFVSYIILAIVGWYAWRKAFSEQEKTIHSTGTKVC